MLLGLAVVARPAGAASGDEFFKWAKWRLGHAPYTCQAGAPWVRPNVRPRVPQSWWERLRRYEATPCTQTPDPPEPPTETSDPPEQPAETPVAEVLLNAREASLRDAVNAVRGRHRLASLDVEPGLERAARAHTADMVRHAYFGHDWHNGSAFGTWVGRLAKCRTVGEILAWHSPHQTPGGAVKQWLNSPGHRAALLSGTWTDMGVELTQNHATVEFGRRC
jgi:uncharacterized protein YkwD